GRRWTAQSKPRSRCRTTSLSGSSQRCGGRGRRRPWSRRSGRSSRSRPSAMRLIVARCEVTYTGRLNAFLPESTRLLLLKDDGSVDLMCRDEDDGWVAVEIKRIGTIDAVEQLTRYLDCIRSDAARAECRGILVAQSIKPQAVALAESRGIATVEVDLAVL